MRNNASTLGWTMIEGGNALTGTVTISRYGAQLCDPYALNPAFPGYIAGTSYTEGIDRYRQVRDCSHGANLQVQYTPSAADQALLGGRKLYWIQVARVTGSGRPTGYPFHEWFIDNGRDPTQPFYFGPGDQTALASRGLPTTWYLDAPENGCAYRGVECGGFTCPADNDHWGIQFESYLVARAPELGGYIMYEGLSWGLTADCLSIVPAPGTAAATALGALVMTRRRRRAC